MMVVFFNILDMTSPLNDDDDGDDDDHFIIHQSCGWVLNLKGKCELRGLQVSRSSSSLLDFN